MRRGTLACVSFYAGRTWNWRTSIGPAGVSRRSCITPGCGKALLRRPRSHARFAGCSMSMTRRAWTPGESGCVVKTRHGRTPRIECSSCCSRVWGSFVSRSNCYVQGPVRQSATTRSGLGCPQPSVNADCVTVSRTLTSIFRE